jgi:hypothetical protein
VSRRILLGLAVACLLTNEVHADAFTGPTSQQTLNPIAIAMFLSFVAVSLGITFWAARRGTRTTSDWGRTVRLSERTCDRRRLHLRRDLSRRYRADLYIRL